jgi:hypothetical protein
VGVFLLSRLLKDSSSSSSDDISDGFLLDIYNNLYIFIIDYYLHISPLHYNVNIVFRRLSLNNAIANLSEIWNTNAVTILKESTHTNVQHSTQQTIKKLPDRTIRV